MKDEAGLRRWGEAALLSWGSGDMSETQALLGKIAALRHRLEQSKNRDGSKQGGIPEDLPPGLARLWELERQVSVGSEQARAIDAAVRPTLSESPRSGPSHLTTRARKVLEKGRELIHTLKGFHPDPVVHEPGLLADLYRETTVLAETALRLVTQLPDSPGGQLQLCEGIEAILGAVSQRLASLGQAHRRQHEEQRRLALVADFLDRLDTGAATDVSVLTDLAEGLLEEAALAAPLRFHHAPPVVVERSWVLQLVAGHSLTTAEVMARLARHEPEIKSRAVEAILAALLHDAGMIRVPPQVLAEVGQLDDEGRRAVEHHCHAGADMLRHVLSGPYWLLDAAMSHHERLDGTGYPDGRKAGQLSTLTRLLGVCDVYAAGCQGRPHRSPRDTRTSLTDALLLAEQGKLDRHCAERLLHLSFYPVGSVVEMADGALAGVVAVAANSLDLNAPARPVVALLTDTQGRFLPSPRYLDLAHSDSHSIVRTLTPAERCRHLGTRYPEWAL